ncbi:MAG TPA: nuclear transport factor 2 family protein [Dehalococcoidia bacterium]
MSHPNEAMLRKAYADFGKGDVEAYLAVCTDDFTFNVPGKAVVSGTFKGREQFLGMLGKVMEAAGGAFEETVHDVLANEEHGVVLAVHRFTRAGKPREYRTAHVYHIVDGKLAECWEQPQDQAAFEEAWG